MNTAIIVVFALAVAGFVVYKMGYWPTIVETAKATWAKIKNN